MYNKDIDGPYWMLYKGGAGWGNYIASECEGMLCMYRLSRQLVAVYTATSQTGDACAVCECRCTALVVLVRLNWPRHINYP